MASDAKQNLTPEEEEEDEKKPSMLATALSGGFSAALVGVALQPLDVIKTRMQADASQGISRSLMGTLHAVVRDGGGSPYALWRGSEAGVIRVALGAGMQFLILEQMKWALTRPSKANASRNGDGNGAALVSGEQRLNNWGAAVVGGVSRAVAAMLMCPMTTVKTRMEYVAAPGAAGAMVAERYSSTAHALSSIWRKEGPQALFRGMVPTIISNAPYSGLYYLFYTRLREAAAAQVHLLGGEVASAGAVKGGSHRGDEASRPSPRDSRQGSLINPISDSTTSSSSSSSSLPSSSSSSSSPLSSSSSRNSPPSLLSASSPLQSGSLISSSSSTSTSSSSAPTAVASSSFSSSSSSSSVDSSSPFIVPQAVINFSCGILASIAATILTQPFDVVRTHAQLTSISAASSAAAAAGSSGSAATMMTTLLRFTGLYPIAELMATRGPQALLSGSVPRLMKRMTQSALVWTLYEELVPRVTALAVASREDLRRRQRHEHQQRPHDQSVLKEKQ